MNSPKAAYIESNSPVMLPLVRKFSEESRPSISESSRPSASNSPKVHRVDSGSQLNESFGMSIESENPVMKSTDYQRASSPRPSINDHESGSLSPRSHHSASISPRKPGTMPNLFSNNARRASLGHPGPRMTNSESLEVPRSGALQLKPRVSSYSDLRNSLSAPKGNLPRRRSIPELLDFDVASAP